MFDNLRLIELGRLLEDPGWLKCRGESSVGSCRFVDEKDWLHADFGRPEQPLPAAESHQ